MEHLDHFVVHLAKREGDVVRQLALRALRQSLGLPVQPHKHGVNDLATVDPRNVRHIRTHHGRPRLGPGAHTFGIMPAVEASPWNRATRCAAAEPNRMMAPDTPSRKAFRAGTSVRWYTSCTVVLVSYTKSRS